MSNCGNISAWGLEKGDRGKGVRDARASMYGYPLMNSRVSNVGQDLPKFSTIAVELFDSPWRRPILMERNDDATPLFLMTARNWVSRAQWRSADS